MINWGKVPLASVLPFIFDSFDGGTGASITMTGLAVGDILVYKGTSMTQRASTAGFVLLDTDGIDIDTITGIHGFSIDTGDNTDAGFFVAGSFYTVVVSSVTIDAQTVSFVAGTFWLGPTLTVAGVDEVDVTHWLGTACATPTTNGVPEVDVTHVAGTAQTGRDLGTSVLLSNGTGAGQVVLTSGKVDVNDKTGFVLSAAGVQAIWDTLTSALTTAGSIGKKLADWVLGNDSKVILSNNAHAGATIPIVNEVNGSVAGSVLGYVGSVIAGVTVTTNNDKTGYSLSSAGIQAIWEYTTRTLTAFSTALALSVWDVLESAIATASSIGLKLKTNLDVTVSSRLSSAGYTAPDNAGISTILSESQSHPTLAEIEASTVLAKEATVAAIKTKTDTIAWADITDIKDANLGKWSINKSTNVLTMYKADGVTVLKQFNLTDNASVSERVPV